MQKQLKLCRSISYAKVIHCNCYTFVNTDTERKTNTIIYITIYIYIILNIFVSEAYGQILRIFDV